MRGYYHGTVTAKLKSSVNPVTVWPQNKPVNLVEFQ